MVMSRHCSQVLSRLSSLQFLFITIIATNNAELMCQNTHMATEIKRQLWILHLCFYKWIPVTKLAARHPRKVLLPAEPPQTPLYSTGR